MDDHLAKPFSRDALYATLKRWLPPAPGRDAVAPAAASQAPPAAAASAAATAAADPAAELLLDRGTLDALRALPARGSQDMLSRVAAAYATDSQRLVAAMERAIESGEAGDLARAAHAWRSCNGHVGAFGLVSLCRELESCARAGDLAPARALLGQLRGLYERVSDELQGELRRSA